jgi:hypothetical protein
MYHPVEENRYLMPSKGVLTYIHRESNHEEIDDYEVDAETIQLVDRHDEEHGLICWAEIHEVVHVPTCKSSYQHARYDKASLIIINMLVK